MEPQNYLETGNNQVGQYTSPYEKREGKVARAIEQRTAKIPSDVFLWAAGAAIVGSLVFQGIGMLGGPRTVARELYRPHRAPTATFIGMWAPTFLLLGLYNKLVKVAGSDQVTP